MQHDLKISPIFFDAVASGVKPFEVRRNDRPFAVGDTLLLKEFEELPEQFGESGYTGRKCNAVVTYILDDPDYCPDGYVILGLRGW